MIGSTKMRQSETMLIPAGEMRRTFIEIHVPGTLGSQILWRGTHWKMSTHRYAK